MTNTQRQQASEHARRLNAERAAKTTCRWGHPLSGENLYVHPATGKRQCRECGRQRKARYYYERVQRRLGWQVPLRRRHGQRRAVGQTR